MGSHLAMQALHSMLEALLTPCQVVYGHLDDPENEDIRRGISYLRLRPGKLEAPHEAPHLRYPSECSTGPEHNVEIRIQ